MATLKVGRKAIKDTTDKFFGLNLTGETQLKKGESPNMTNCRITDSYDLTKMDGYKQMMKTAGNYKIQGMWHGYLNGTEHFIFASNGIIYKVTNGYWNDDTTWESTNDFTTHSTSIGSVSSSATKVRFFDFGNRLYVLDGESYKYWNGVSPTNITISIANPAVVTMTNHGFTLNQYVHFSTSGAFPTGITEGEGYYVIPTGVNTFNIATSENGTPIATSGTQSGVHTLSSYFSNVDGYIPKTAISCTPATGAGTLFEVINQLTGKKHKTYNGDATNVYKLGETNIASVDHVYVDGTLKTVTTHYTVDLTAGTVTFTTGNLPAVGLDNVDIYWSKANNDRTIITKNKAFVEFKNRIFLYGNSSNQNSFIYSELANRLPSAEYFPVLNTQPVGKTNTAITDITNAFDRLVITKPNSAYYALYDSYTLDGVDVVNFPVYDLNETTGNVAFAQGQVINNYPVTLEKGIKQWISTSTKEEKNASELSNRIMEDLNDLDLSTALTIDFQEQSEYWIVVGTKLYIYKYNIYGFENGIATQGVFSRVTLLHNPNCLLVINGEMYFGTDLGLIMKFSPNFLTFNDTTIDMYWESRFDDFGANYLTKTLDRAWIGLQPQLKSSADVNFITNIKSGDTPASINHIRQIFMLGEVDFSNFSFAISANPQPKAIKIKAKKFTYLKITITNESATDTCKILNITTNINFGGESK